MKPVALLADSVVVTLASMRLTRLIIRDDLGERYVQQPLDHLVSRHTTRAPGNFGMPVNVYPSWVWLRDGMTCPACVGFWLGLGVLTAYRTRSRTLRHLLTALALNEVVVHAGSLLGDFDKDED